MVSSRAKKTLLVHILQLKFKVRNTSRGEFCNLCHCVLPYLDTEVKSLINDLVIPKCTTNVSNNL